jgi:hypothetical protein
VRGDYDMNDMVMRYRSREGKLNAARQWSPSSWTGRLTFAARPSTAALRGAIPGHHRCTQSTLAVALGQCSC